MNKVIKVTSPSFSKSEILRNELRNKFPDVEFNEDGVRYTEEELIEYLETADAAIVGLENMSANVLSNLPNLKILSKYGVGLDGVDIDYCLNNNIKLGWTPGVNKRSAAELTLCFMIGLSRNVFNSSYKIKINNIWDKVGGFELSGKTIGIIGVGHVGKDLISLLKVFNCKILVNDVIDQDRFYLENNLEKSEKDRIFRESDVVTLHVPLTNETHHLVNESTLEKMKKTAFLVNVSRGSVVDQDALKSALERNAIAGAALDVFEEEPAVDTDFISLENLACSPHIGGNSKEAILSMGRSAILHLEEFYSK
jgi:phosphoglycerate dehydrogenase-like enzyme